MVGSLALIVRLFGSRHGEFIARFWCIVWIMGGLLSLTSLSKTWGIPWIALLALYGLPPFLAVAVAFSVYLFRGGKNAYPGQSQVVISGSGREVMAAKLGERFKIRFERRFNVSITEEVARRRVSKYVDKVGFTQIGSEPILVFRRGQADGWRALSPADVECVVRIRVSPRVNSVEIAEDLRLNSPFSWLMPWDKAWAVAELDDFQASLSTEAPVVLTAPMAASRAVTMGLIAGAVLLVCMFAAIPGFVLALFYLQKLLGFPLWVVVPITIVVLLVPGVWLAWQLYSWEFENRPDRKT